jgi:hypothetical protein
MTILTYLKKTVAYRRKDDYSCVPKSREVPYSLRGRKHYIYSKFRILCSTLFTLKVGGNEKNGGSGRSQMLDNGLRPWRSRFFFNLNMKFLSKMSYFLSACNSKMNRRLL